MSAATVSAAALCVIALSLFASFVLTLADVLGRATERMEQATFREEALELQVKNNALMQQHADGLSTAAFETGKLFGSDSPKGH